MSTSKELPNYFDFYELPWQFNPDQNLVKAKFYANSKKYHPDFFANDSEEKQNEVLELSTLNNKAYQVLSHPAKRLKYLLELKGVVVPDESYQLPSSFLAEMMDVNEALMELEFEPDAEKLQSLNATVRDLEIDLTNQINQFTTSYDEQTEDDSLLQKIKDLYYRQKYISRLKEKL